MTALGSRASVLRPFRVLGFDGGVVAGRPRWVGRRGHQVLVLDGDPVASLTLAIPRSHRERVTGGDAADEDGTLLGATLNTYVPDLRPLVARVLRSAVPRLEAVSASGLSLTLHAVGARDGVLVVLTLAGAAR